MSYFLLEVLTSFLVFVGSATGFLLIRHGIEGDDSRAATFGFLSTFFGIVATGFYLAFPWDALGPSLTAKMYTAGIYFLRAFFVLYCFVMVVCLSLAAKGVGKLSFNWRPGAAELVLFVLFFAGLAAWVI